ncbi:MAG: cell division ATP-binding protein FtsE [Ruminococcus sp.]|nr:cell division ATP-binding protein FtsE [Ruminococcus sp.]
MVELKNVSVTYSSGVDALNNVSLKINDGDFAFVVGSSGAGKSTMIKLLLKEIDATDGTVTVNGYNLNTLRKKQIPEFRRTLGFVFQDFRLIPSMTVYENIAFVLRVIDAPTSFIRKRVPYVIGLVGLQDKEDSYPDELSGGEMQRVAIARALVNDPQLIIADEPTGNIDPELSYEIVELLKGINDQGTTILMVTHEHDLVRHFGGRIINITDGQIVYDEIVSGISDDMLDFEPAIIPVPEDFQVAEDDGYNDDDAEELLGVSEFPDMDFSDDEEEETTPQEEDIISEEPTAESFTAIAETDEDVDMPVKNEVTTVKKVISSAVESPEKIVESIAEEKSESDSAKKLTDYIPEADITVEDIIASVTEHPTNPIENAEELIDAIINGDMGGSL